jgi:hypothetical protein
MVQTKTITADNQIKDARTDLWGIIATGVGVTAGDKIEFSNSASGAGTALITVVLPSANSSVVFTPAVGMTFTSGLYADYTKTGGTLTCTLVYD